MIYFFTSPYNYESNVTMSSAGGTDDIAHPPEKAIDSDKLTYWENDGANPDLIINLGSSRDIDSLWFKHYNIDTFNLYYSDDGAIWDLQATTNRVAKGTDIFWQFDFTLRTKQYWKISVTAKLGGGNVKIYELMLMKQRLTLGDDEAPAMVTMAPQDMIGGSYEMADGSTKSYSGNFVHTNIKMEFKYAIDAVRDNLCNLYSTPLVRPPITILPDDDYAENIYRCIWKSTDFPFRYTIPYKGSGWTGNLEWQEY